MSGFYMVVVDLDFIRGDSLVRNAAVPVPQSGAWLPIGPLRRRCPAIESVRIKGLPGIRQPLCQFRQGGKVSPVNGVTCERLSSFTRRHATALARQYCAGVLLLIQVFRR